MNNLFVILWVSWCKNKCFWKRLPVLMLNRLVKTKQIFIISIVVLTITIFGAQFFFSNLCSYLWFGPRYFYDTELAVWKDNFFSGKVRSILDIKYHLRTYVFTIYGHILAKVISNFYAPAFSRKFLWYLFEFGQTRFLLNIFYLCSIH